MTWIQVSQKSAFSSVIRIDDDVGSALKLGGQLDLET